MALVDCSKKCRFCYRKQGNPVTGACVLKTSAWVRAAMPGTKTLHEGRSQAAHPTWGAGVARSTNAHTLALSRRRRRPPSRGRLVSVPLFLRARKVGKVNYGPGDNRPGPLVKSPRGPSSPDSVRPVSLGPSWAGPRTSCRTRRPRSRAARAPLGALQPCPCAFSPLGNL